MVCSWALGHLCGCPRDRLPRDGLRFQRWVFHTNGRGGGLPVVVVLLCGRRGLVLCVLFWSWLTRLPACADAALSRLVHTGLWFGLLSGSCCLLSGLFMVCHFCRPDAGMPTHQVALSGSQHISMTFVYRLSPTALPKAFRVACFGARLSTHVAVYYQPPCYMLRSMRFADCVTLSIGV